MLSLSFHRRLGAFNSLGFINRGETGRAGRVSATICVYQLGPSCLLHNSCLADSRGITLLPVMFPISTVPSLRELTPYFSLRCWTHFAFVAPLLAKSLSHNSVGAFGFAVGSKPIEGRLERPTEPTLGIQQLLRDLSRLAFTRCQRRQDAALTLRHVSENSVCTRFETGTSCQGA